MRVLLAIGCNTYNCASQLAGAELDARRMFDVLMRPEVGQYDTVRSKLLLSPSLDAVRHCLRELLLEDSRLETFTFYFAGHGGVWQGSFYMWLRDTSPRGQSMSALSLADIFRMLNEAVPRQSNIIIDACNSGGLVEDLVLLLKPNLIGDAGTPGMTLVATSAQNQVSGETQDGGLGTNAILDCIEGRDFVQDSRSVLDLMEIGRRVSVRLQDSGQNPVVWGLNLYGAPSFCRNPRYASDPMAPLRDIVQSWPVASDELIKKNYEKLWGIFSDVGGSWDFFNFIGVVYSVIHAPGLEVDFVGGLVERLAITFLQKAEQSRDPFRSVQVAASFAIGLLPYVEFEVVVPSIRRMLIETSLALFRANSLLINNISSDDYALLSDQGGVSDLYQLPMRIAKVLGWAGVSIFICADDEQFAKASSQFAVILRLILEKYSGSVVALSDAQAPFWSVALLSAAKLGLKEEGEQLAGLIFHSLIQCEGKLARWDLSPDKTFDYLFARKENNYSGCMDLVERPIETLTVLLKTASLFDLGCVFDESLWKLDGVSLSAYIPNKYEDFGVFMMKSGRNFIWSVGEDVFKTEDLEAMWPDVNPNIESSFTDILAIVASLLFSDRQPWFLFRR